jgi:hypothetical protein
VDDESLSLAERRPRRQNRQLPWRFRDILPQALPLLPPRLDDLENSPQMSPPISLPTAPRVLRTFQTLLNKFGLFRRYHAERLPCHDPEEHINLQDLVNAPECSRSEPQPISDILFHPYPNKSSFLLGDWYWNHGVEKSRQSFKELLEIVGSSDFTPEHIRQTKWDKINVKLASNDFDLPSGHAEDGEWMDEDAGWRRTPITISVPFHSRTAKPGSQDYVAGLLYHRSLVSVIREKLANPLDDQHFHYDPFELFWRRKDSENVRVHGELYTSSAFLDAHNILQSLPGEPGCDLQRVIVAMMFSSDVTHFTSFGNAKLWPCYLYFGNESKYRRSKPTLNCCNHVAYFQKVRNTQLLDIFPDHQFSCRTYLRTLQVRTWEGILAMHL